jgi:uncharacterized delta-60 repeat protein
LALQPDAKILLGGAFTTLNGVQRNYIGRLNSDGSLDGSFLNAAAGADGAVNSILLQPDARIVIGGAFAAVNITGRNRIARLNSDGSLDSSFLNGLPGANGFVYSLQLQANGKIVLGGSFTNVNGKARNRIARLNTDGSVDGWFNRSFGPNDLVSSVAMLTDGRIVACGDFTRVNGVIRGQIARLLISYDSPRIEDAHMQAGQFQGLLTGAPGDTLAVQASTDFTNWTSLTTNILANEPPTFTDPQSFSFTKRFYRLQKF